jgi:ABC-type nickel/cobalt efflux system permease component RcnA
VDLSDRLVKIWDADLTRFVLVILTLGTAVAWIASGSLENVTGLDQPTATLVAGVTAALGSVLIGVLALYFAWRNTRATLRHQLLLAEHHEVAKLEATAHMSIAVWLGQHSLLREGAVLDSNPPLEPHLPMPSNELMAQAHLFAAENVWRLFARMREIACLENESSRRVQLAMESVQRDPGRTLPELREDWVSTRAELEVALRRASRRER